MQIIELSEFRDEEGLISLGNRVRGTVKFGFGWYGDMQAQERVTRKLQGVLDDDHMLLLNAPLVGTDVLAPMILFSPQGVRLLYPSTIRGNLRAQDDRWLTYNSRARQFKPKKPNLQFRALAFARGLIRYFESQGFPLPQLEAVLLFTNPQTHVDAAGPQARIVLADAFEHFAASILEEQTIMDQEDIHMLVDSLLNPKLPEPEPELDEAGEESFESEALRPREDRQDLRAMRRFGSFTTRQWIVIGVLGVFQLILVLAIAFIVLGDVIFS
ncbi:MAG: hypothetical protein ACC647_08340 [Anaerolineales bacterium]